MVLVPGKRKEKEGEENKWSKIILKSKEEKNKIFEITNLPLY